MKNATVLLEFRSFRGGAAQVSSQSLQL